ncbi:hypothetical protein NDU88_005843 [Pleurodeles waltl]|uniref:Secreted protein n=1 Tax=Pleurodeles waltl TaxID=8319 RepID=A0AAV7TYB7_PLEWA|nr:hypothetical protein NDU88_005843 [Pleurodeles waltl]
MAFGCSLFLDALRSLAHCCLVCVSDGQSAKKRQAVPARLRPSPPHENIGKSGSGWKRDCNLEAKLQEQRD